MRISKYTSDFHDGALTDINQKNDCLILTMRSAEVDPDDIEEALPLGKYDRIQGKLHLEGVSEIIENKNKIKQLRMNYDKGSIFRLFIDREIVVLKIAWVNFPPNKKTNEFSTVEIKAKKIWWENLPDSYELFW